MNETRVETGLAAPVGEGSRENSPSYDEVQVGLLANVVQQMMKPVFDAMAKVLQHNAEALDQLSSAQTIQNNRMEALEKQIRLNTLVTPQQVRHLNNAIRARARELLSKYSVDDAKSIRSLGTAIRKSVLSRYGIGALHEIPKHEYAVAMSQVGMWIDPLIINDVKKEARKRHEIVVDSYD